MSSDLTQCGVTAIAAATSRGEASPTEVVDAFLARIEALDPRLGALLSPEAESARARARALESSPVRGPLFGVPIGIKDNIAVEGWPLTCASKILEGYEAPYTATAVARLENAGAIPFGRCNMDEFAFGSSTEHSAWQTTRNPWNLDRIPGGSSGGSAAAVAAGLLPAALGSDTGGSIRQPAALCGVTGIKPTYGRVSRFGLVAFGSSLDQIGPLARSAADAEAILAVLAGQDPRDATSLDASYAVEAGPDLHGLRVGLPRQHFDGDVAPDILARVHDATETLADLGADLVEVELPHSRHAIATYYLVATSEASSNLARFDGVRYGRRVAAPTLHEQYVATRGEGFGEEAQRRILLGTFCLSAGYYDAYYLKALQLRTLLRRDYAAAFESVDVLVGPTTPFPAYTIGESAGDPIKLWLCDLLTVPANLAGIPALSLPCGFDSDGMPVGLQLQAPVLADARLLRVARAFQTATDHHTARPEAFV